MTKDTEENYKGEDSIIGTWNLQEREYRSVQCSMFNVQCSKNRSENATDTLPQDSRGRLDFRGHSYPSQFALVSQYSPG